jgi:tetratricopeptide (TPR) repeat protein
MRDPQVLALEREADKLRQEKQYELAIEKIQQALAIDPSFVRGHLSLAVLYQLAGQYEKSCEHAEKACQLEPNDTFNHAALSVTYQRAFEGTRDPAYIEKAEIAKARSQGY